MSIVSAFLSESGPGSTTQCAFDSYIMVDWSSSATPKKGKDSIWIAQGSWLDRTFTAGSPQNVSTRIQAVADLRDQIVEWREEGRRVLVGFDFAFGYPAGLAEALGLNASVPPWQAVHRHFSSAVKDSPDNRHNRDAFADECNRRIGAPGPFWGCCAKAISPSLTQSRKGRFQFPHCNLEEWRETELAARRRRIHTQSVWKLNCGVSVGGQTILGIKHLHELACATGAHSWPFEGWGVPVGPGIWFAEIFPALVPRYPEWATEYTTSPDRAQMQSCVRYAAEQDSIGALVRDFASPASLDNETLAKVENEEGWILWV